MIKTINVASLSELHTALSKATGGETILLAQGNYGNFALNLQTKYNIDFPSNVTVASADPSKPAVFSGLDLRGATNLTIDGVTFDYTFQSGQPLWIKPFDISAGSANITIRNSTFDGDLAQGVSAAADGLGYGLGLNVQASTAIRVENNTFTDFYRGLVMGGGSNYVVSGNEMSGMRMDGMNFAHVQNILIENNYLHDFNRSSLASDHADMIQFWTNGGTTPSTNIIIRGNTLDVGGGDSTQSIFMRNDMVDRGLAGTEMYYQNVLIENNTIYNGHLHGITVGETNGLTVRNNTVLHADGARVDGTDAAIEIPRINLKAVSTNVTVSGNVVAGVSGWSGQSGWTVSKNAFVQDQNPNAPGYYEDVFIASTLNDIGTVNQFVARPGGMVASLGAGSSATQFKPVTGTLEAQFHVSDVASNGAARVFDASLTTGQFNSLPAGTTFTWDFGDGTTAKGPLVTHNFPTGGYYDVKLIVKLPTGVSDVQTSTVGIAGPKVLSLAADGSFIAYDHGTASTLSKAALASTAGLQLGTTKVAATVHRDHLSEMFGADNFDISLRLKADTLNTKGEVFRLHNSFFATVNSAGELEFTLYVSGSNAVKVVTKGAHLSDKAAHDVSIKFDAGQLQIFVDGNLGGKAAIPGLMSSSGAANLLFGNPWGAQNFHGDVQKFGINIDAADYTGTASSSTTAAATTTTAATTASTLVSTLAYAEAAPEPTGATEAAPTKLTLVAAVAESAPAPLQDSLHKSDWSGLVLDIANLAGNKSVKLADDAHVATTLHGPSIVLDGKGDYVSLGRITSLEKSDQIAFAVDFARDTANGDEARLVWNNQKIGLTLKGDGIVVQAARADGVFQSFTAKGLGLNDTDLHRAVVMLDAAGDRLQVVVDDAIVLDVTNTDFDIVGAGGREGGWIIGTPWNRYFDGDVTDFRLGDRFEFLDAAQPETSLI